MKRVKDCLFRTSAGLRRTANTFERSTKSKTALGKATRSFQTRSVRKRSFQVSFELPWGQSDTIKHSAQTAFEPGKSGLAGLRGKFKSSKAPSSTHSLSFSILPHEVQKNQLLLST